MVAILIVSACRLSISQEWEASKLQADKGQKARDFYARTYQELEMLYGQLERSDAISNLGNPNHMMCGRSALGFDMPGAKTAVSLMMRSMQHGLIIRNTQLISGVDDVVRQQDSLVRSYNLWGEARQVILGFEISMSSLLRYSMHRRSIRLRFRFVGPLSLWCNKRGKGKGGKKLWFKCRSGAPTGERPNLN